jgi:NADH:ubiquinone oxidoreductase subunit 6 (subunit J)
VFKRFIPILLSLAVLVFFWGLVKFINHADDEKELEDGKQLMIWGMISLFVMIALWSIIGWIQSNLGLNDATSLGTLSAMPNAIPDTTPAPTP